MISDTVIVALISGAVTASGSLLGFIATTKAQKKKDVEENIATQKAIQKGLEDKLDKHREEYLAEINNVYKRVNSLNEAVTDMRAQTQSWQSVMELRLENLAEKVTKHNQFMERLQKAELDIAVLKNRERVSEHRLADLEDS